MIHCERMCPKKKEKHYFVYKKTFHLISELESICCVYVYNIDGFRRRSQRTQFLYTVSDNGQRFFKQLKKNYQSFSDPAISSDSDSD
jgi:hypothetical protein